MQLELLLFQCGKVAVRTGTTIAQAMMGALKDIQDAGDTDLTEFMSHVVSNMTAIQRVFRR